MLTYFQTSIFQTPIFYVAKKKKLLYF